MKQLPITTKIPVPIIKADQIQSTAKNLQRGEETILNFTISCHIYTLRDTLYSIELVDTPTLVYSFRAAGCLFLNLRVVLPIVCEHSKNQQNLVNRSSVCLFVNHYCWSHTGYLLYVMGYTLGDKKKPCCYEDLFFFKR